MASSPKTKGARGKRAQATAKAVFIPQPSIVLRLGDPQSWDGTRLQHAYARRKAFVFPDTDAALSAISATVARWPERLRTEHGARIFTIEPVPSEPSAS